MNIFLLLAALTVVEPTATDEALINPGMGFVHYAYSSRIWAYDTNLEPGDTLDWIPGTSVVYIPVCPGAISSRRMENTAGTSLMSRRARRVGIRPL